MIEHRSRALSLLSGQTRRRILTLFGLAAASIGLRSLTGRTAAASPVRAAPATQAGVCLLSADVTQGPYFLQHSLVRQDITEGKSGFPLNLTMTVVDYTGSCTPIARRPVEIWHCDAWGYYSGYTSASPGGTAPSAPNAGKGPAADECSSRSQFAVLFACQIPFKSGRGV